MFLLGPGAEGPAEMFVDLEHGPRQHALGEHQQADALDADIRRWSGAQD